MARSGRLGELLVDAGNITREQLGEALRRQENEGGKLGTNLVELGFLDERTLGSALARQHSVPSVTREQLEKVPADLISLIPGPLAARLRVVPLRLDAGKLWLAMSDPSDADGLDEIARLVKKPVRPTVAADAVMQAALEKHYRLPPRGKRAGPRPFAPRVDDTPLRVMLEPRGPKQPAPVADDEVQLDDADVVTGYLDEEPAPKGFADEKKLPQLLQQMVDARGDDEVLDLVLKYLAPAAAKLCVLTLRRTGELTGWRGINVNLALLQRVRIPLADLPLLQAALQAGQAFVGNMEAWTLGALAATLDLRGETLGMVLPIRVGETPAGVLLGLHASKEVMQKRAELDKLALKIDQALHLQYLKRALLTP